MTPPLSRDLLRRSWRSWLSKDGRDPGPWWLPYLWTLVFCLVVAAGFTAFGYALSLAGRNDRPAASLWRWYEVNLMISLAIGCAIHFLYMASIPLVGRERLRRARPWQRSVFYTAVPIVGVAIGWPLGLLWALGIDMRSWIVAVPSSAIVATVLIFILVTIVFQQFFSIKARQIQAENRANEAQLRLLQAQIEPHFLFNTLANVVSLIETDPVRARSMLESFVDYLRASLSGLGRLEDARHTLGNELALVTAYLRVIETRMEGRLRFDIDVAPELHAQRLPPLTVQPLVENAIVHGLEPSIDGGTVRVSARMEDDTLVVCVDDDGTGLRASTTRRGPGNDVGVALGNIRARLRELYGSAATLTVEPTRRGVRACLRVPTTT